MRKQLIASIAALVITGTIALSMLAVGVNAATNPNGVPVSNSPAQAASKSSSPSLTEQEQIAQLQSQIAQYQARDQQYQAALQSDNTQLS